MKTLVEDLAIDRTSNAASRTDTATYFATDPKPGQLSVIGRSLSTVFGMPMQVMGYPMRSPICDTLCEVSWESPPPL